MRHTLLLITLLALAACGGKKDDKEGSGDKGGKVASCNLPSMGACQEYRGGNLALGVDHVKGLCDTAKKVMSDSAVFSETACPADGRTGKCARKEGTEVYYASYPIPMADAEKACTGSGGTWSAK